MYTKFGDRKYLDETWYTWDEKDELLLLLLLLLF
jgi:hypothetical protein